MFIFSPMIMGLSIYNEITMQVNTFPIILEDAFMLSSKVKHFIFSCTQTPVFDYLPGQFITIHFECNGKMLRRSYSIANIPKQNNRIEFAAGFVENGPASALLFNLKQGDTIQVNGPFGRLILKDELPSRYILVATSTGITPYRAMIDALKERLERNPLLQVVILQGVQYRDEVLYRDAFLELATTYPNVIFRAQLSREAVVQSDQHEYAGHVQTAFPSLNLNPQEDLVYLCGNANMIDDAFTYLKEEGFETQQIIREKYLSR